MQCGGAVCCVSLNDALEVIHLSAQWPLLVNLFMLIRKACLDLVYNHRPVQM